MDRENAFAEALEEAEGVVLVYRAQAAKCLDIDGYPQRTLARLCQQVGLQARAVLRLVGDATVAGAADVILRSLVEGVTQIRWICDGVGDSAAAQRSATCRALCFEVGAAQYILSQARNQMKPLLFDRMLPEMRAAVAEHEELRESALLSAITQLDPDAISGGALATLEAERDRVSALHKREGCRCRGRRYDIQPTLRALQADDPLAHIAWIMGASVSHHTYPSLLPLAPSSSAYGVTTDLVRAMYAGYAVDLLAAGIIHALRAVGIEGQEEDLKFGSLGGGHGPGALHFHDF